VVDREWRWHDLQTLAEMQQSANALITSTGTLTFATFGGAVGASGVANAKPAASVLINYLTDGFSGDNATELGSALDCNTPANSGLKMELVGTPANVATNASYLFTMGRRYFGNLSGWQTFS